jgi:hypothetical protein
MVEPSLTINLQLGGLSGKREFSGKASLTGFAQKFKNGT